MIGQFNSGFHHRIGVLEIMKNEIRINIFLNKFFDVSLYLLQKGC